MSQEKTKVVFVVKNNGFGMNLENKKRTFERFYRGENTVLVEGSGLGSYVAKHIVKKYNRKIDLISEQNRGTEIKITL